METPIRVRGGRFFSIKATCPLWPLRMNGYVHSFSVHDMAHPQPSTAALLLCCSGNSSLSALPSLPPLGRLDAHFQETILCL